MKNEEASYKTTSNLLAIARKHFTEYGYFDVVLEKIAEEGNVTRGAVYHHFKNKQGFFTAVLECVQKDVSTQIEKAAMKSDDPWQQLILGCVGFVKAANERENKRILLVDAPAVLGWTTWRQIDQENSMNVLQAHISDLKEWGYLSDNVDTELMTYSISGALNELALNYSQTEISNNDKIINTITQLVHGFRKI
ncbi:MAG: TetR/AcrR family transcriptional regulator [Lachnospiraceae bacterium]|nr:TetR/AcrR family transcriptional regulator [Lachnospiraceae bacterium]